MIALTSVLLGIVAISFRSALVIVATVWFIFAVCLVSAVLTLQIPSLMQIFLIIGGYNLGLIAGFVASLLPVWRPSPKNA